MNRQIHHKRIVSRETFKGMHRVARDEDIDKGGLYDSRGSGINIWCSPEDKPVGYGYEIETAALDYPRDFIASILPERKENKVVLELKVEPERAGTEFGKETVPTKMEKEWAIEKLDELVEKGANEGVMEEYIICPICGQEQDVTVFNEFVKHLIEEHKLEIESIIAGAEGNIIKLKDGDTILPKQYIRKRVRK